MIVGESPETATATVRAAFALAYLLLAGAGSLLVVYLGLYMRRIFSAPYRTHWRYLSVGVGAAVVYGVTGLVETVGTVDVTVFRRGATLFFFLFCAVGLRAIYESVRPGADRAGFDGRAARVVAAVLVVATAAWWGAYLLDHRLLVRAVDFIGLTGAVTYSLVYAVRTVRTQEGTSAAAVTRQFVPALIALAVVAAGMQLQAMVDAAPGLLSGLILVGTVAAGMSLFTTAVAIRQQGGEVKRMYDPTVWRETNAGP